MISQGKIDFLGVVFGSRYLSTNIFVKLVIPKNLITNSLLKSNFRQFILPISEFLLYDFPGMYQISLVGFAVTVVPAFFQRGLFHIFFFILNFFQQYLHNNLCHKFQKFY